ncbi:MAG TPA: hypothetical protein VHF22_00600, partial [Planctomycetota bacterium]|nr:hypothetical protein [Planctomycetota bacterium]
MKRSLLAAAGVGAALLLGTGLLAPRAALADRIVLKSGRTIEGKILEEATDSVKIECRRGAATFVERFERREISEVIHEASPAEKWDKAVDAASKADELLRIADEAKETAPRIAKKAW